MHVVSEIWNILDAMELPSDAPTIDGWCYTWAEQANVHLGSVSYSATPLPYVVFLVPSKWTLELDEVAARERVTVKLYFLVPQSQLDFNATSNETSIDWCIDAAVDFCDRVKHNRKLHINKVGADAMSLYDVNNRNLTGVCVSLDLTEKTTGRCLNNHTPRC